MECYSLPETLDDARQALTDRCADAQIPADKVKDFLSLDWSPDPVPFTLLRRVLVFQRCVLRVYRYSFQDEVSDGPLGFPDV